MQCRDRPSYVECSFFLVYLRDRLSNAYKYCSFLFSYDAVLYRSPNSLKTSSNEKTVVLIRNVNLSFLFQRTCASGEAFPCFDVSSKPPIYGKVMILQRLIPSLVFAHYLLSSVLRHRPWKRLQAWYRNYSEILIHLTILSTCFCLDLRVLSTETLPPLKIPMSRRLDSSPNGFHQGKGSLKRNTATTVAFLFLFFLFPYYKPRQPPEELFSRENDL